MSTTVRNMVVVKKEPATEIISFRISRAVKRRLNQMAEKDARSTADYIRIVLRDVATLGEFKAKP